MIGCALIGNGYWGSKLKRYVEENHDFDLKYVCNSRSDLSQVWQDKNVGAVVVATPNATHYSVVKSALLSGKNVLAEKPLALKTTECEELGQIARDSRRVLLVEYTYTYSRGLQQAQSLVKQGAIGKILGCEMSVRHLGRFGGGSVYWLLGSHMLSVLDMFIPIKDIQFTRTDVVTNQGEVETGIISFRMGDVTGQIVVSLNYPGKETRVILYGERGTIIYDPLSTPSLQIETYQRLKWKVAGELPRQRSEFNSDESNNLRYAVEHFAKAIAGKAEGNAERATAITRILEGIQA